MSKAITNGPKFVTKFSYRSKMPAFTLYGAPGSTNTNRVRLTLAEGGFTDYEFEPINLQKGEQKVGKPITGYNAAHPHTSKLYIANTAPPSPWNT
jgi:hypothetical protein